jgi:hypothetical protein
LLPLNHRVDGSGLGQMELSGQCRQSGQRFGHLAQRVVIAVFLEQGRKDRGAGSALKLLNMESGLASGARQAGGVTAVQSLAQGAGQGRVVAGLGNFLDEVGLVRSVLETDQQLFERRFGIAQDR